MDNPRIAFCTTCKGRAQHVKETLPKNLKDNADYENAVFVILDYGSPDGLAEYIKTEHSKDLESGRVVYYSYPCNGSFKMAHAKNLSHRAGVREGADVLVNLDADNFTEPQFASWIAAQYRASGDDIFLWAHMIPGVLPRGVNGRIAVTKYAYLNAGGYDERFHTWSHDDKDFNIRLRRLGYTAVEIETRFLNAVRHNDKMRFKEYPHVRIRNYDPSSGGEPDQECILDSEVTICNFGKYGQGTLFRNFSPEPIEFNPAPTRIFGIGMHKTATTSLHLALGILGFDSAHWISAHWAKAIWCEMNALGRSATLERHYALSDLPVPMLFRELDKAYPGSKFILTTRSEEKWLNSVRRHWGHKHNKFRSAWDTDPFSHQVHKALYGQKNFDQEIFLARFRKHNQEVLEHFKDRPGDLLVFDMEDVKWDGLCSFLEKPVPDVPYPSRKP